MSSLKLLHSGGNGVIISAPSSNPAANRTITLNDNYAGDGSFVTANSSGNVGIGTSSPQKLLDVRGEFAISNSNSSYWDFDRDDSDGSLKIKDTGTERMRLSSSGDFKIATTVDEPGNGNADTGITLRSNSRLFTSCSGTFSCFNRNSSDGALFVFARQGTHVGNISVASSSTSFNTSSDYRLKENVTAISDGITRLKTLKPSRFNFKVDKDTTVDGFLAHEVTAIVPSAVVGAKDAKDSDDNPIYQQIDHSKLVPLLVKTIQELEARIATLEG